MHRITFDPFSGGDAVSDYCRKFRHPDLPSLDVAPPIDLYPERPLVGAAPQLEPVVSWPFAQRAGVYIMYDDALDLLYIGKVSMNRCLGQRLYEYFGGGDVCVPKFDWLFPVRFLVIIAMPEDSPFEAPSLEEYLIRTLHPKSNVAGRAFIDPL